MSLPHGSPAQDEGAVAGSVRVWLRCEGGAVLAASGLLYGHLGARWWVFAVLLLAPDLSMLGYLVNPRVGAHCYNVAPSYVVPPVCGMAALAGHRPGLSALVAIWTAHIGIDRLLGYGLKYGSAFGRTHLGRLGRQPG